MKIYFIIEGSIDARDTRDAIVGLNNMLPRAPMDEKDKGGVTIIDIQVSETDHGAVCPFTGRPHPRD